MTVHGQLFESPITVGILNGGIEDLACADVNLDGAVDVLAMGDATSLAGARLFLNDGSGNFTAEPDLIEDSLTVPECVFLKDLDGDWYPDAVYQTSTDVFVSMNQRGRGFAEEVKILDADIRIEHLTIVDLDCDGDQDLVYLQGLVGPVMVVYNEGEAGWTAPVRLLDDDYRAFDVSDLDGDGHWDIAAAEESDSATRRLALFFGNGSTPQTASWSTVFVPYDNAYGFGQQVMLEDFTGDGFPDVAMSEGSSLGRTVLFEGGGASRVFASPRPIERIVKKSYARGDVTGDGLPDILTESQSSAADLLVYHNTNGHEMEVFETIENGSGLSAGTVGTHVADFDGDGHVDAIYAQKSFAPVRFAKGTGQVIPGDHQAKHEHPGVPTFPNAKVPQAIRAKATAPQEVVFFAGTGVYTAKVGSGGFDAPVLKYTAPRTIIAMDTGNLDADAADEIVIALGKQLFGNPEYIVLDRTVTGALAAGNTGTLGGVATLLDLSDINEDGALDLIAICQGDKTVRLFHGDGLGDFGTLDSSVTLSHTPGGEKAVVVDYDGDGNLDILTDEDSNSVFKTILLIRSNGTSLIDAERLNLASYNASPAASAHPSDSFDAPLPALGDYDNDGDLDRVTFSTQSVPNLLYCENITPPAPGITVTYGPMATLSDTTAQVLGSLTLSQVAGDGAPIRLQSIALRFRHVFFTEMSSCAVDAILASLTMIRDLDNNGSVSAGDVAIPVRLAGRSPGDLFIFNLNASITDALTLSPGETQTFLIMGEARSDAHTLSRHGAFRFSVDAARFVIEDSGFDPNPLLGAVPSGASAGQVFHLDGPSTYHAFQFNGFGTYDQVPPLGTLGDIDGDGMTNLYEYLAGTEMNEADPDPVTSTGEPELILQYSERVGLAFGDGFTPEWSPDLLNWYESGDGPPGDSRTITITLLPPEAAPAGRVLKRAQLETGGTKGFLQVRGVLAD